MGKKEKMNVYKADANKYTKLSNTALKKKYRKLLKIKKELKLQKQNLTYYSIREDLDLISKRKIDKIFSFPNKETMIEDLQNDSGWNAQCLDSNYVLMENASIHFIKWSYFLTFCKHQYCVILTEILKEFKMSLIMFCVTVEHVYTYSDYLAKFSLVTFSKLKGNFKQLGSEEDVEFMNEAESLCHEFQNLLKSDALETTSASSGTNQPGPSQTHSTFEHYQDVLKFSYSIEQLSKISDIYFNILF